MEGLRLAGGVLAVWCAGRGLLVAAGLDRLDGTLAGQARSWLIGLCALAFVWFPLAYCGVPFNGGTIAVSAVLLSLPAWRRSARLASGRELDPEPTVDAAWQVAAGVLVAVAIGLFTVKTLIVPLWSWDHFAIWGVKARWLAVDPRLDFDFLRTPTFARSRPDHPLGLPMAWLVLGWGGVPSTLTFKAVHLLSGGALLALLGDAVRRRGWEPVPARLAVAFVALSPLYWDTGNVGLAEMLFGAVAVCAADLLFDARLRGAQLLAAGAVAGALPWIKQEGVVLAILLVAGAVAARIRTAPRRGELAAMGAPILIGIALSLWFQRLLAGNEAAGYLGSGWGARATARWPEVGAIALAFVKELLVWDWLGFWPVLLVAVWVAAWLRRFETLLLGTAVLLQLGAYLVICYLSYADPHDQIQAAIFRLAAPLVPLALLALALSKRAQRVPGAPGA